MHKSFCSILNAKENEPIEATAPERQALLLFPEKKGHWHTSDKQKLLNEWKPTIEKECSSSICERASLYFYRPTHWLSAEAYDSVYLSTFTGWKSFSIATRSETVPPSLLIAVCTDGKKDACCAKFGLPIYREILETVSPDTNTLTVECSHIGGCRFAATLLFLPSGNVYGRINRAMVREIIAMERSRSIFPTVYRGNIFATEIQCWITKLVAMRFGYTPSLGEIHHSDIDDNGIIDVTIQKGNKGIRFSLKRREESYRLYSGCGHLEQDRRIMRSIYGIVENPLG